MNERFGVSVFEIAAADGGPPEWLHVMPFGRYFDLGNERFIELTPQLARQVVARFESEPTALPIDYRHETLKVAGDAPQAGRIDRLELRADGVWGHVQFWTPLGAKRVIEREYSYLSPVIAWDRAHRRTGERGPELLMVALTNIPNLSDIAPLVAEALSGDSHHTKESGMKEILVWLAARGHQLPDDATPAAVVAALEAIAQDDAAKITAAEAAANSAKEQAAAAETARKLAVLSADAQKPAVSELEAIKQKLAARERKDREAEADAAIACGKIGPAQRDSLLTLLEAAPEPTRKMLDALPATGPLAPAMLINPAHPGAVTAAEADVAKQLGLKPEDMKE